MSSVTPSWDPAYRGMVQRNIGILSEEQQEKLRASKVAVFGLGGLGGVGLEVLVRSGVGSFSIVDRDVFEDNNLNRQVLALRQTLGERKIDVAEERAEAINPLAQIEKFDHVDDENVRDILDGAKAAYLGIDDLRACLLISRAARELGVPLIEGWALPYANVRVFTPETPSLEEAYNLPTIGRPVSSISDEDARALQMRVLATFVEVGQIRSYYSQEAQERIRQGRFPSFAPTVWLTAVVMALETLKVLLGVGEPALSPRFAFYDPFLHRVP